MEQKEKRMIPGMLKLVAAAMIFGLVAGAAFRGYNTLSNPVSDSVTDDSDNYEGSSIKATPAGKKEYISAASNTSAGSIATDVSDVVEKFMPSIVAINSTVEETTYDFFGRGYTQESQSSGSGIIIGQNEDTLYIVTNNHVIDGTDTVQIVFIDDTTVTAEVKGADANADIAVLTVDTDLLEEDTAAAIRIASLGNSNEVNPGELAIAIGNALGYGQSVTVGYISAVNREVTIQNQTMTLLQTDAAINPGNSGGALLNAAGELIGINSVKYASEQVEGMGYAIPISQAVPLINELMNREVVSERDQGYLGIDVKTAQEVTDVHSKTFHMPIGVYINDVVSNSPAEKAGLVQGNIITAIDYLTIESIDDLINALSYKKAGQEIKLTVQVKENGVYTEKILDITLSKRMR